MSRGYRVITIVQTVVVLAIALAMSVGANTIQYFRNGSLETKLGSAQQEIDAAEVANESNASTIATVQGALAECVGQRDLIASTTELAMQAREDADKALRDAVAIRQRARSDALLEPTCIANANLPVCPGLVGE